MVAIEVVKSELVFPSEETPKHRLWISNTDIMFATKLPTPMIYVYHPNGDPDFFNVEMLKAGLSKALVPFYPLAGRLAKDRDGRLEVDCGRQGVLVVVARSDSGIDDFGEFLPSPELCRMLTPSIPSEDPDILFMTQVTFFKGGEVILGTVWCHVIGDGLSAMNFISTWSRITRGVVSNLDIHPLHDRTLLRARSPPKVLFNHVGNQLPACAATTTGPSATSILPLTKSQLALLTTNNKISTFCAISAHVWKCVSIARGLARDQAVQLKFVVNVRRRMKPPLPDDYFGNAVCRMVVVSTADDVLSNPIEVVGNKIRDEIRKVDEEYVRSFIDHFEMSPTKGAKPPASSAKFSLTPTMADFAMASWIGMPIYDADFGWGKPEIVRIAAITDGQYAYIMEIPKGGGVLVLVSLEEENMERFKEGFYEGLNMHGTIRTD
uniref:Hydroxycinnamoyltransferase 3 n=1 Tax=Narcissus papyraceus TaxID=54854 RepID=A0A346TLF4_NARPA|nr:hydroxycinnamoyltransferase 3 [Narcissus papyraceus]